MQLYPVTIIYFYCNKITIIAALLHRRTRNSHAILWLHRRGLLRANYGSIPFFQTASAFRFPIPKPQFPLPQLQLPILQLQCLLEVFVIPFDSLLQQLFHQVASCPLVRPLLVVVVPGRNGPTWLGTADGNSSWPAP